MIRLPGTAPPAFGIYEEDDPLQVGALRPWELVAVAASLLGAAAFAAYLACICRRRFCTDMDDDAPAEVCTRVRRWMRRFVKLGK